MCFACSGAGRFADSGCDRYSVRNSVSFADACAFAFSFGFRNTRTFGFAGGDSGGNQM